MCLTCGCGDEDNVRVSTLDPEHEGRPADGHARDDTHPHEHHHPHEHDQPHDHGQPHEHDPHEHGPSQADRHASLHDGEKTEKLILGEQILAKNDHLAEHNRAWLQDRRILAINLMSSPGSGKTSLLERTIAELGPSTSLGNVGRTSSGNGGREICVIEGDQETLFDAERIRAAGARAVQVNTGAGCHLDAPMVQQAIEALAPSEGSLLFIENVGNLVCPALFDVGERAKVVVISVTEGDDKPLKYPRMFGVADLVVINETDLLPYVDFDLDKLAKRARSVNPGLEIIALSVRTAENLDSWYAWLNKRSTPVSAAAAPPTTEPSAASRTGSSASSAAASPTNARTTKPLTGRPNTP